MGHAPGIALVLHPRRDPGAVLDAIGEDLWTRFNAKKEGTLWYYRAIVDTLPGKGPIVEELDRVVTELEILSGKFNPV